MAGTASTTSTSRPSTAYRAVQASEPGGRLSVADVERSQPAAGHVRLAVEACGICHSDVPILAGYLPGTTFPLTPGHEIVGRIDAVGDGVEHWSLGERVAAGYIAGSCGHCDACRDGDVINCPEAQIPGVSYPGGLAAEVILPVSGLSRVPDALSSPDAAVLACAGLSAYDALRNCAASPGDVVAVLGLGGVGHLAVQYAARMGFETVAVSRGSAKAEPARELGAHHYIDSANDDTAEELRKLGGAKAVIATTTSAEAISASIDGLSRRGDLVVIGLPAEELHFDALSLIAGMRKVYGRVSGTPLSREAALRSAALSGVRPWIEPVRLEDTEAAYRKMESGQARFRMVVDLLDR